MTLTSDSDTFHIDRDYCRTGDQSCKVIPSQKIFKIFNLLAMLLICSCQSLPIDPGASKFIGREMWTATNLRVFKQKYIYWQNYLHGTILTVGTRIRLQEITSETATFIDNADREYVVYWRGHGKSYGEVFEKDIHKYFTLENPEPQLKTLTQSETEMLQIGGLKPGMSKKLVFFSCGFPHDSEEPMKQDTWIYWLDTQKKCAVQFENDIVIQIIR